MAARTEQMKKILEIRREDPEKEKELCMQMLTGCEDKYTEAFGRTYLGDAYHTMGQIEHALPEYKKALELAGENAYDDLLSMLYNSVGVVYMYNDDEQSALDYFFSGIELAEKLNDKMMHATLLANIAYVYRSAGALDEAEKMMDESYRMIREAQHNDANVEMDELGYKLDKIWIKLQKHETDEAWKRMQCDEIQNDDSRDNKINFAIYYEQISDTKQCLKYIEEALEDTVHEVNQFEEAFYLFELIEICIKAKLYTKAEEISDIAEKLLFTEIGTVGKWTTFMGYRIEIYEALGRTEELKNAYEKYYVYDQEYEEEKAHATVKRVRRKIELLHELDRKNEIKQRQADLYDRRGRDALTKLYNRWGIKGRIETLYQEYCGRDLSLAVAIADVDFFKEYNDTYGHIAGDKCLKTVAEILKKNAGEESIVGRYGGDEFLIVLWGKTQKETEQMFDSIREELADNHIENKNSAVSDAVTVTAGGVITKLETWTDFTACLHEADLALYEVKKQSRDGYKVKSLA